MNFLINNDCQSYFKLDSGYGQNTGDIYFHNGEYYKGEIQD